MKKRILVLAGLSLITSLSLVSCGTDDGNSTNGEIFDETRTWEVYEKKHLVDIPVEINFWSANSAVDIQGKAIAELVDDFNAYQKATYPTSFIKVKASFQGGYGTQNTKLQAALTGSNNPEIAQVGVSSLPLYTDSAVDQRTIFTYDDLRDVNPGFLQYAMHKNVFVGYPYFASTNVLIANRTLLESTGKTIPTPQSIVADPENSIWNWDYMKEVSVAVTDTTADNADDHIYGYAATGPGLYEMMYTQGVAIYNETATEINFNNEAGLEGLRFWRSMVTDGAMLNPVLDPNHGTKIQGSFASVVFINGGLIFWSFQLDIVNPNLREVASTGTTSNLKNFSHSIMIGFIVSIVFAILGYIFLLDDANMAWVWGRILGISIIFFLCRLYLFRSNLHVYFKEIEF